MVWSGIIFLRISFLILLGLALTGVTYAVLRLIGWGVAALLGTKASPPPPARAGQIDCTNPGCDQKNRLGAKFCGRCGRPLARAMFDAYG